MARYGGKCEGVGMKPRTFFYLTDGRLRVRVGWDGLMGVGCNPQKREANQ
jgi:hypothetical protein